MWITWDVVKVSERRTPVRNRCQYAGASLWSGASARHLFPHQVPQSRTWLRRVPRAQYHHAGATRTCRVGLKQAARGVSPFRGYIRTVERNDTSLYVMYVMHVRHSILVRLTTPFGYTLEKELSSAHRERCRRQRTASGISRKKPPARRGRQMPTQMPLSNPG